MSYIENNKAAWEEAFENRKPNWGENNHQRLKNFGFFDNDAKKIMKKTDFQDKNIAHFCCNNGRELLSLLKSGKAKYGTGFDFAENILNQARETAAKAGIANCDFVNGNILEIPDEYYDKFDFLMFTTGGITWFKDLQPLFEKASKCLKKGGTLFINDSHPVFAMLPLPCEAGFDPDNLDKFTGSYFRKEPWTENNGMDYMSRHYKSKTFTSFSHTLSDIVNALSANGITIVRLHEYDYDVGLTEIYDKRGIPLSYILIGEKQK